MASTFTVQNSIDWSEPFLRFMPLDIGIGNEPSLSNANIVKQIILGAPFCWRWNRAAAGSFATVAGTQDYTRPLADFGFLEKASLTTATETFEVPVTNGILGASADRSRPEHIATQMDDNAGNITFRFVNNPDQAYSIGLIYQKKPSLITLLSQTWSPIPDEYSFVYNQGFLAFSAIYADDPRWAIAFQRFLASLVGVSEGLDETQKSAFVEGWLSVMMQSQSVQQKTNIGSVSRTTLK